MDFPEDEFERDGADGLYEFLLEDEGVDGDFLFPLLLLPFGGEGDDDDEEPFFDGGADELEPEDIFRAIWSTETFQQTPPLLQTKTPAAKNSITNNQQI